MNTFLTPNGEIIQIRTEEIPEFCNKMCEIYCQNTLINKQYLLFCQKYKTLNPNYDFILHKLRFIHIGILNDETLYGVAKFNQILIKKMPPKLKLDVTTYQSLFQNHEKELTFLSTYDDDNLDFKEFNGSYQEGLILQNGKMCTVKNIPSHIILINTLITGLIASNSLVAKDVFQYSKGNDFFYYIVYRLGIVILSSLNPPYGIYDFNLLTSFQKDVIQTLSFDPLMDQSIQNEMINPYTLQEVLDYKEKVSKSF